MELDLMELNKNSESDSLEKRQILSLEHYLANPPASFGKVLEDIYKQVKQNPGKFLFRGEHRDYGPVTSSMFRQVHNPTGTSGHLPKDWQSDLTELESSLLGSLVELSNDSNRDRNQLRAHLQHHGYSTNLIDFSYDCNVALYFASEPEAFSSEFDDDGRVIIIQKNCRVIDSGIQDPRALAQKSVFYDSESGIIPADQYEVVVVPRETKHWLRSHLRDVHGVELHTIFPDFQAYSKFIYSSENIASVWSGIQQKRERDYWLKVVRDVINTASSDLESPRSTSYLRVAVQELGSYVLVQKISSNTWSTMHSSIRTFVQDAPGSILNFRSLVIVSSVCDKEEKLIFCGGVEKLEHLPWPMIKNLSNRILDACGVSTGKFVDRVIDQWSVIGLSVPEEFIDVLHERDVEKVAQGIRKFLSAEGSSSNME